jgi:hypothetical protein
VPPTMPTLIFVFAIININTFKTKPYKIKH